MSTDNTYEMTNAAPKEMTPFERMMESIAHRVSQNPTSPAKRKADKKRRRTKAKHEKRSRKANNRK